MAGKGEKKAQEREASKKWVPSHKERSTGSSPHSLWHVWCLVFWPAPSGAMLERAGYTLQQPANDELRTSQKGSLNLAP